MAASKMIVFHGTTLPVGSDSSELRRPSLRQPFFVADNPKSAIDYAISYSDDGKSMHGGPSVFVLRTSMMLDETSFDFNRDSDIGKLRGKFPKTIEYIQKFEGIADRRYLGTASFFNAIDTAIDYLRDVSYDEKSKTSKETFDISAKLYPEKAKENLKEKIFAMLEELGFMEIKNNIGKILPGEMKKIMSSNSSTFWGDDLDVVGRRLVKERIYKAIYDLGYLSVIDHDSSPNGRNLGHEYAVFDMKVFDDGYSESMSIKEVQYMFND